MKGRYDGAVGREEERHCPQAECGSGAAEVAVLRACGRRTPTKTIMDYIRSKYTAIVYSCVYFPGGGYGGDVLP